MWFAYLAAIATIISYGALFIFFARGGIFGPINDAASVFQMLFLIPVALAIHEIFRHNSPALSLIVVSIGILAMVIIAILQGALVLQFVRFEKTLNSVLWMGGVLGGWWLFNGWFSLMNDMFPELFSWLGIVCGVSALVLVVGFRRGGQNHPLAVIGFLTNAISVPIWTIWMGNILSS